MINMVTITRSGDDADTASWVPMDQLLGSPSVGAETMVIEGYTGRIADGRIAEIDNGGRRVRVDVNWATLRGVEEDPALGAGGGAEAPAETSPGRFGAKALSGSGGRWGFRRAGR